MPEASWVHTSLLHPLGYRGGPFWWPGRSRFSSSQQAARVDLIGQARPPHARPATCTRIWPPERAGRAGTGSAQRPKSPVRAGPAGAAGRRGLGRPDWLPLPLAAAAPPRRLHAAGGPKSVPKHPARHNAPNLLGGCWRQTEHVGGPTRAGLHAYLVSW